MKTSAWYRRLHGIVAKAASETKLPTGVATGVDGAAWVWRWGGETEQGHALIRVEFRALPDVVLDTIRTELSAQAWTVKEPRTSWELTCWTASIGLTEKLELDLGGEQEHQFVNGLHRALQDAFEEATRASSRLDQLRAKREAALAHFQQRR